MPPLSKKKNVRIIPEAVEAKLGTSRAQNWVAACIVRFPLQTIRDNEYTHLTIRLENGRVAHDESIVPIPDAGRYSKRNRFGWKEELRKLPKTTRSWSVETPNFGDWGRGSHPVEFEHEAYQKVFHPPRLLSISIQHVGTDPQEQSEVFRFTVDEILGRDDATFDDHLLFDLNLLQENTGTCDVYDTESSLTDYLRTLYVDWEILPPGEMGETINKILGVMGTSSSEMREIVTERYKLLHSLRPVNWVVGTNGFRRYMGAQFADDLVVFENLRYGNAVYVMFDDWQSLSKRSRLDLLSSDANFRRIVHSKSWKEQVRATVRKELEKRKQNRVSLL